MRHRSVRLQPDLAWPVALVPERVLIRTPRADARIAATLPRTIAICLAGVLTVSLAAQAPVFDVALFRQNDSTERAIRLRFPDGVDLTGLSIQYFLTGPFGGYGSVLSINPAAREQSVDTWREDQQGREIKIIIYCPGYGFRLVTESGLAARRIGTLPIQLEPLGSVFLAGRISGLPASPRLTIEAGYFKDWECAFFNLIDCLQGSITVATSTIADDGTFTLNIPDFLRDPVVTSYRDHGRLTFRVLGANRDLDLVDAQNQGQRARLPIAPFYPGNLQLIAVPR